MRYKLDINGYVISVAFGCYLEGSTEYTGEVPCGYNSLDDWSLYACIQAYFIDSNGNLVLDLDRLAECRRKEAQDKVDYTPLVRKDLYESDAVLDSQYLKGVATGEVIILEDIQTIAPIVRITGIEPYLYSNLSIFTQGRNMMPCNAIEQTISGVDFLTNYSGSITAKGTATEDIEYTVLNGGTKPVFTLKKGHDYYLNLGGLDCELRYFDGENTFQQYVGASGLLNLDHSIEVNQVIVKIASGTTVETTFFAQLEYGTAFTSYEAYKSRALEIDFSEFVVEKGLYPSNTLLPSNTLYPNDLTNFVETTVEYILIENGVVYASIDGVKTAIGYGNVGLYSSYDTIYASKDVEIEITYSTNVYDVDSLEFLQGKATTSDYFKILEDGSIRAHNGYFSGEIVSDSAKITGGSIEIESGTSYNLAFLTLTSDKHETSLSSAGATIYDLDKNGYSFLSGGGLSVHNSYGGVGTLLSDTGLSICDSLSDFSVILGSSSVFYSTTMFKGTVYADFLYVNGTKSRVATTEDYGKRLLYCYETPSPMFGDIGEGRIDDTGKCYVFLDDVFAETIDTDCKYQVFLQPYGKGECYVSERNTNYFVVEGTENLLFGWELKAIQKDFDTIRLEEYEETPEDATTEILAETSNYLNSLLYNVESEEF